MRFVGGAVAQGAGEQTGLDESKLGVAHFLTEKRMRNHFGLTLLVAGNKELAGGFGQLDGTALAGLSRPLAAVKGCRTLSKKDLVLNTTLPKIEVDPESYEVRADGELLTCEPADVLPLAQRYFLF